jgi:regulator of sirC expression with transglutaminase-like and TPR domain
MQVAPVTALTYFTSLVASDSDFPLLEAAAAIAQDEEPSLDIQAVLATCDALMVRLKRRLKRDAEPIQQLTALNHFFYQELGFSGNANNFYAPENSYLNEVFRTRRGIPISIAVIWLELARGLGLQADGVSFPGHFLVKVTLPEGLVVLDPLTGQSLGLERLSEQLLPFRNRSEDGEDADTPLGLYLQPASPRDILTRMLRNLKEIFSSQTDWPRLKCVLDRLIVLNPDALYERRDRGLACMELGLNEQAKTDLSAYVSLANSAGDVDHIRARLALLESDRT